MYIRAWIGSSSYHDIPYIRIGWIIFSGKNCLIIRKRGRINTSGFFTPEWEAHPHGLGPGWGQLRPSRSAVDTAGFSPPWIWNLILNVDMIVVSLMGIFCLKINCRNLSFSMWVGLFLFAYRCTLFSHWFSGPMPCSYVGDDRWLTIASIYMRKFKVSQLGFHNFSLWFGWHWILFIKPDFYGHRIYWQFVQTNLRPSINLRRTRLHIDNIGSFLFWENVYISDDFPL